MAPDPQKDEAQAAGEGGAGAVRMRFGRGQRLTRAREFEAVHRARMRKVSGPLSVSAIPNGLGHSRLGLAIGRKAGGAVQRSRFKRLIREAFRLEQGVLPRGYDFVVSVRSAGAGDLAAYREALVDAALDLQTEWERRMRREAMRAGASRGPMDGG